MRLTLLASTLVLGSLSSEALFSGEDRTDLYPPTRRVDQVDHYHGKEIADPYRWLEGNIRQSTEVAAGVSAEHDDREVLTRPVRPRCDSQPAEKTLELRPLLVAEAR
jgi:hypothetical protein